MRHSGLAMLFGLSMLLAAPASALQKFEQYRIMGSEISAVRIGPQEVEDPATLIIELVSDILRTRNHAGIRWRAG
jgi:hypothetical protein